jgi:protein required for attachment to host cells
VKRSQDRSGQEEGIRWRPSIEILERELENIIEAHGPHGEVYESLEEDKDKIFNYLENDLDPAAQGAFFVSCSANNVFEASGFSIPLETEVHVGPAPVIYPLVRLVEDYPTYGVLLADQREARLSFITSGRSSRSVTLEGSGYPRHQSQGGWSQRRFQNRAEERVEAFARDVAEETRKALDRLDVDTLIVAGNEVMTSALDHEFHQTVKERVVQTIHMDMTATDDEVLQATRPIAEREERQREASTVQDVRDNIGADGRGVGGPEETLQALQAGQVDTLVLTDTFEGTGWGDFEMQVFGVGSIPDEHPLGGDVSSIVEIDLRSEMVRLALATDAEVDIIHSDVPVMEDEEVPDAGEGVPITEAAKALNEIGGAGARLRYTLDETAPPESV